MPIRGANDTLEAYRTTTVPIHESQADVRELLRARKATGMQISESWADDQVVADVRFGMPGDAGGFYAYRIRVRVPPLVLEQVRAWAKARKQRQPTEAEARAQGERQIWRLVYWWLKTQFEAADAGLVSLEEAFLPWMELPDGRTTYEAMAESGGLAKIASGTLPQLTSGRP
jgi:hypothetical protein